MYFYFAPYVDSPLANVGEPVKAFAWISLIVGLLSMAVLQTMKDLLPWRKLFHREWILRWFRTGMSSFLAAEEKAKAAAAEARSPVPPMPQAPASPLPPKEKRLSSLEEARRSLQEQLKNKTSRSIHDENSGEGFENSAAYAALRDLLALATGGDVDALFDLPIEQLCGQINAAVQLALERPADHIPFLWCIGRFASPGDLDQLLNPPAALRNPLPEVPGAAPPVPPDDRQALDAYLSARARVSQRLQRGVDGFQIKVGIRWKLVLQLASIGICLLLAFLLLAVRRSPAYLNNGFLDQSLAVLGVGFAGGFIAPVARDVLALLGSRRG